MATYIIYERDSGRIVHTHVQPEDLPIDREGLLALLEGRQEVAGLATVRVDPADIREDHVYRVEPTSRELKQVELTPGAGFGMGAVRYERPDWSDGPMKVTYSRGEAEGRQKR